MILPFQCGNTKELPLYKANDKLQEISSIKNILKQTMKLQVALYSTTTTRTSYKGKIGQFEKKGRASFLDSIHRMVKFKRYFLVGFIIIIWKKLKLFLWQSHVLGPKNYVLVLFESTIIRRQQNLFTIMRHHINHIITLIQSKYLS